MLAGVEMFLWYLYSHLLLHTLAVTLIAEDLIQYVGSVDVFIARIG